MGKKILFTVLSIVLVTGVIFAQEFKTVSKGESVDVNSAVTVTKLIPNPDYVNKLQSFFGPLQDNPKYYGDRRFRKVLRAFEVKKLKAYKPNFGKKIWVKSWQYKDIKKKIKLFGKKINRKKYYISAIEVAEDVTKFLSKELKNEDIDYKKWARKIEEFGRTYVNPDNAGKKKCKIVVADYQNGNYIMIKATKPFNKRMVYFISEDYDAIIKALLRYKTRKERKSLTEK